MGRTEVLGGRTCHSEELNFKIKKTNLNLASSFADDLQLCRFYKLQAVKDCSE
jgi:hypothetical protein